MVLTVQSNQDIIKSKYDQHSTVDAQRYRPRNITGFDREISLNNLFVKAVVGLHLVMFFIFKASVCNSSAALPPYINCVSFSKLIA